MLNKSLSVLLSLFVSLWMAGLVSADLTFGELQPSYSAASTLELTWKVTGDEPKESELGVATFLICTGSNNDISCPNTVPTLSAGKTLSSLGGKLTVDLSTIAMVGADGPYFIQLAAAGGQYIVYTDRFKLTGMKGTKVPTDGGDTSPPPPTIPNTADDSTPDDIGKLATLPYTLQTGRTRVAPMQMQPGTKVTRPLRASRRFPTSAVTFYSSQHAPAKVVTTITPSWTYTAVSATNTAKAQPKPTKFYAASAVLKSSILAHSKGQPEPSSSK